MGKAVLAGARWVHSCVVGVSALGADRGRISHYQWGFAAGQRKALIPVIARPTMSD